MFTVYLIRSTAPTVKTYVGYTTDLEKRLHDHNTGKVRTTKGFGPWHVEVAIQFADETKAKAFERYLKHGSGHAFAKRHFW